MRALPAADYVAMLRILDEERRERKRQQKRKR